MQAESPYIPPQLTLDLEKTNDVSVKLIRCLVSPECGRYLLDSEFKKIVLDECTKKLFPKTREAALGLRCKMS